MDSLCEAGFSGSQYVMVENKSEIQLSDKCSCVKSTTLSSETQQVEQNRNTQDNKPVFYDTGDFSSCCKFYKPADVSEAPSLVL